MAQIAHLVRIRAAPEEVYRRVASTAGIAEWFTQASSRDYRKGGILELRFSEEPVSFTITELTEPSRIVWHCTTKGNSWFNTDIAFEFAAQGDHTVVRFDHLGWPELTDRFRDLEEGRGTPESLAPSCEG
jgi:uncharacterized protein YndB with AHSA1/START domain